MNTSPNHPSEPLTFLTSIKQFPAMIFNSLNAQPVPQTSETYPVLRILVQRMELTHNLKVSEFAPYVLLKIANESRKTLTSSQRDPYNAIFNEVFEYRNIPMKNILSITLFHRSKFLFADKYIGNSSLALDNPLLTTFRKLALFNESEKDGKLIGYLYLNISFDEEARSGVAGKKRIGFISDVVSEGDYPRERLKPVASRERSFAKNDAAGNKGQIESIYLALNQEKKAIGAREAKLRKLSNYLKEREAKIEAQRLSIQRKKDELTEEENSLVLEKERFKAEIKLINRERESIVSRQNQTRAEISRLELANIKHKLRGDILLRKLADQTKYMNEINDQIYLSNESQHQLTEKMSYVTLSYIEPQDLNDIELYSKNLESHQFQNGVSFRKHFKTTSVELQRRKRLSLDLDSRKQRSQKRPSEKEQKTLISMIREEKRTQKRLDFMLSAALKEEKRIFEQYQRFLKINPASYTASSNLFQTPVQVEGLVSRKEVTPLYSRTSLHTNIPNSANVKENTANLKEDTARYEHNYRDSYGNPGYFDSNRFRSMESLYNIEQFAQPVPLSPLIPEGKGVSGFANPVPISSSQLFNDYFVKNNNYNNAGK